MLCGRLPAVQRPVRTPVRSDCKGRVYLPGYGTFSTEQPNASGDWIQNDKRGMLRLGDHYTLATFQPETRLDAHGLVVHTHIPAVFERFSFAAFTVRRGKHPLSHSRIERRIA